jgi:hypothetical protein
MMLERSIWLSTDASNGRTWDVTRIGEARPGVKWMGLEPALD